MQKDDLVVLTVDDDLINLRLLKSMLMKSTQVVEVIGAENGADAIDILRQRDDIDLILLDIVMPVMNGIEMLKIVRSDEKFHQLPIIVLTTDETKKTEALECGANGFITKPIRRDDLNAKIEAIIF